MKTGPVGCTPPSTFAPGDDDRSQGSQYLAMYHALVQMPDRYTHSLSAAPESFARNGRRNVHQRAKSSVAANVGRSSSRVSGLSCTARRHRTQPILHTLFLGVSLVLSGNKAKAQKGRNAAEFPQKKKTTMREKRKRRGMKRREEEEERETRRRRKTLERQENGTTLKRRRRRRAKPR